MKIPSIALNRGVESTGRADASLPVRVGAAQAQVAAQGVGNIQRRFQEAQVIGQLEFRQAQNMASAFQGLEQFGKKLLDLDQVNDTLEAYQRSVGIRNRVTRSIAELSAPGTLNLDNVAMPDALRETLNAQYPNRVAPSHEVADTIHSARVNEWATQGLAGLSERGQVVFLNNSQGALVQGSTALLEKTTQHRDAALLAKMQTTLDLAIESGDPDAVKNLLDEGLRTGLIKEDEYPRVLKKARHDQYHKSVIRDYARASTVDDLDALEDRLFEGNPLTPTEEAGMFARIERKRAVWDKARTVGAKNGSNAYYKDLYLDILTRKGPPMPDDEFRRRAMPLKDSQFSRVVTAQEYATKGSRFMANDQSALNEIQLAINEIRQTGPQEQYEIQLREVEQTLNEFQGTGKINRETANTFREEIQRLVDAPTSTSVYRAAVSSLRSRIRGGIDPDDMIRLRMSRDPAAVANYRRISSAILVAEKDLRTAVMSGADPQDWVITHAADYDPIRSGPGRIKSSPATDKAIEDAYRRKFEQEQQEGSGSRPETFMDTLIRDPLDNRLWMPQ